MNALVVINSKDQDESLKVAFDQVMNEKEWKTFEKVPSAYLKIFDDPHNGNAIAESIKKDIDDAVFEAEWQKLNYLILLSDNAPDTWTSQ